MPPKNRILGLPSPLPARFPPLSRGLSINGAFLLCVLLLFLSSCSAGKDFRKASELDTIDAYRAFLEEHKDNEKYSAQATQRLEQLSLEKARKEDTFSAYAAFLKEYPVGKYSQFAERRGEELRAKELGIHLYRILPKDYFEKVSARYLPYRILVRVSDPQGVSSPEFDMKWYEDLVRRDLFVPMNPRKSYAVSPDITLVMRLAVIYLCNRPSAFVEAEAWAGGKKIKTYRITADEVEKPLLYEIFSDRELYDAVLGIPKAEKEAVRKRFETLRRSMPRRGSVAFEVDLRQDAYSWDRDMALEFSEFLNSLRPYEVFTSYLRGQPPETSPLQRAYLLVDTEIHSPYVRTRWSTVGPSKSWKEWNSKWIVAEKEYFFQKMTLDLVAFLAKRTASPEEDGKTAGRPLYAR
jgi:hypothetical protein